MKTLVPPGELQRLVECVQEPIRFPGAVQRHGALIVADARSRVITHVSDNTQRLFDADPHALLGRPLGDLFDTETLDAMAEVVDDAGHLGNPVPATLAGRPFDLIAHLRGDRLLLELEPHEPTPLAMTQRTRNAMRRFVGAGSVEELWRQAADELRAITGFDRVMVYHFHPDDHGEIVADARAEDMEPYEGLHYPASDIPAQARALYVTKLSRMIADGDAEPAGLLADARQPDAASLDLSDTELRAVSPHHRRFMRNMGQTSTFSLSLVLNGRLIGMITCAHRTERHLPYNIRDGLEILANQVALQLESMRAIERLAERNEVREIRSALVSQLAASDDLVDALMHRHLTVLDLIRADGAAVRLNGRLDTLGRTPDAASLEVLERYLRRDEADSDLVSECLEVEHPDLVDALPGVAGLLVKRVGAEGDYLAWFRSEVRQTVKWLGDMSPGTRETPLSPRNSFSEWSEEVSGTSEAWGSGPLEARDLANDVQATMLQRMQSQLAAVALHDPLTGLPNRRLFTERLRQVLGRGRRDVAVVFIDVDRFKAINDEFGHSAGDDALRHVAAAVGMTARAVDTVARLGGDEFVVLAEGAERDDAVALAERILVAIEAEPAGSPGWRVSASIGVAVAAPGEADPSHLLSAADTAMYRAKDAGRGRVST
jgi:diguanylate cyclase (GGDEF)-like protein